MSFETLGLSAELLRAVKAQGHDTPTPVQQQAIPAILEGRDALVAAPTGTGKTGGFTLPMLHLLQQTKRQGRPVVQALILTPTRELAAQIFENVQAYGKYLPLKAAVVYGGVGIVPQIHKIQRGVDILVATPGRLLDLVSQRVLQLSDVNIFVLDEADRMLDMGFIPDIRRILTLMTAKRQNLLFSATFSSEIKELAAKLLHNPVRVEVAHSTDATSHITHIAYPVDRQRKRELLSFMIGSKNWQQVLVFTRTKHGANRLAEQLESDGLSCTAIHGNKSQGARMRALSDFKQGKVRVLVATDVAARGIDIEKLPHVVNFDLPSTAKDYVHRVGRTGRAANDGVAISLVAADERKLLNDIEKLLQYKVPQEIIPGYEPMTQPAQRFAPKRRRFGQGRPRYSREGGRDNRRGN